MPRRHAQTRFPLTGGHLNASCEQCHIQEQKHQYVGLSIECYSCHAKDYQAAVAPPHAASGISTECASCHSVQATTWGGSFNHAQTGFILAGAHAAATCASCHAGNRFKGTPTDCNSCHQNDYTATKNPAHAAAGFPTTCIDCHSANAASWSSSFAHAQTGFALAGAHTTATCASCHVGNRFKGTPTDCYACHQPDYTGALNPVHSSGSFPTTCVTCHSTSAWRPSTFNHSGFFPISAGSSHAPGRWNACSDCHTSATNFAVFSCLTCHEHNQASMDSKHSGKKRLHVRQPGMLQLSPKRDRRMRRPGGMLLLTLPACSGVGQAQERTAQSFVVTISYITSQTVYLDGGKNRSLAPGDTGTIYRRRIAAGRLVITAVSNSSSSAQVVTPGDSASVGDTVFFAGVLPARRSAGCPARYR